MEVTISFHDMVIRRVKKIIVYWEQRLNAAATPAATPLTHNLLWSQRSTGGASHNQVYEATKQEMQNWLLETLLR